MRTVSRIQSKCHAFCGSEQTSYLFCRQRQGLGLCPRGRVASGQERGSCVRKTFSVVGAWLFRTVCLCPQWQVLNKAKNHIQELEQSLDTLLKLKGERSLPATPLPPREGLACFSIENKEIGLSQVNIYLLRAYCVPGTAPGPGVR